MSPFVQKCQMSNVTVCRLFIASFYWLFMIVVNIVPFLVIYGRHTVRGKKCLKQRVEKGEVKLSWLNSEVSTSVFNATDLFVKSIHYWQDFKLVFFCSQTWRHDRNNKFVGNIYHKLTWCTMLINFVWRSREYRVCCSS